jgi:hypothetical protein
MSHSSVCDQRSGSSTLGEDYTNTLFAEGRAIIDFTKSSRTNKLYLVGNTRAGKTSLRQVLDLHARKLEKEIKNPSRTRGIEVSEIHTDVNANNTRPTFRIHDFGGHSEFRVAQNMFVDSDRSVFIVVVNLRLSIQLLSRQVDHWISYLLTQCGTNDQQMLKILLVGTHADEINKFNSNFDFFDPR